jgi:PAS domain S-box-containing protein
MTAVPPLAAQSDVPHRNGAEQHLSQDDRRYFAANGENSAAALLSTILDNVYQGIALFDANRRLVLFNQPYPDLLDYPDGFLQIGMSYDDILRFNAKRGERGSPVDPDAYVHERLAHVLSMVPSRREHTRPNGKVIAIRFMPTPNGGFINTYVDITDRKRAEDEAAHTSAVLKATLENMADGVRVFDKDLRLIACNRQSLEMFGYPPQYGEIGTPYESFMYTNLERGDYGDCTPEQLENRLARARSGTASHTEHTLADGRVIQKMRNPMPDGGFVSTYLDITERKRAEQALAEQARKLQQALEELQRSNAELEQFAYVASHDLQEPLRMVASYCQLLQRRYQAKLDQNANEFISFAVEGAKRMQSLINDLLLYSRVGTKGKAFAPTALEQVLGDALVNLTVAVEEARAEITHGQLPTVMGDPTQLLQLFQNLIGNALKFRREAPVQVRIDAHHEGGQWVISVSDNGIGIDPQYAERIFMIFQRLHTREQYPGTGIGLSVCKKIVERHGGRIWVESAATEGSVFKFSLPD